MTLRDCADDRLSGLPVRRPAAPAARRPAAPVPLRSAGTQRPAAPGSGPPARTPEADLLRLVAHSFHVSAPALLRPGRSPARESLARQTAMYLMHVCLGRNHTDIAVCFARHRTTVRHACARIEDRRDDPLFDGWLDRLEARFAACLAAAGAGR